MSTTFTTHAAHAMPPRMRNQIVWLDLGERIDAAIATLREMPAMQGSRRLQQKLAGVIDTQAEFARLTEADTPYVSLLLEWLTARLERPTEEQRERRSGYELVLDYSRGY